MPRWNAAGLMEPTSLTDAAPPLCLVVRPVCRCGHSMTFDPHGLWWHFQQRGWDDRLSEVRRRFWCFVCMVRLRQKVRPVRIETVNKRSAAVVLAMPPKAEWKRQSRALR
jgi:hypothetical protein